MPAPSAPDRAASCVLPLPVLAGPPASARTGDPGAGEQACGGFSPAQVSQLLWQGLGLTRHGSGGRVAALSCGRGGVEVYVCLAGGAYRYEPVGHALHRVSPHDGRALAGACGSGAVPSLVLVYVTGMADGREDSEECGRVPNSDPAALAEHVASYGAKAGLDAQCGEWFAPQLARLLALPPSKRVAFTQTVRATRRVDAGLPHRVA